MSEQAVPWALRRRALVRCPFRGRWLESVGRVDYGEAVWETYTLDDDGEPISDVWINNGHPTAILPDQCPRCYEVGTHAPDCMVAANLARGVFPHFAPWVMWIHPDKSALYALPGVVLMSLDLGHTEHPERSAILTWDDGWKDGRPVFAIGPEGFTLEPWRKS